MEKEKLIIPLYLNERIILDLMAIVEDGFSTFSTETLGNEKNNESSINGKVSANLWEVLKTSLKSDDKEGKTESSETQKEKTHTPTSLFSKLIDKLEEDSLIKKVDDAQLNIGDFILINNNITENPILKNFKRLKELLENLSFIMPDQTSENKEILKQIIQFGEMLESKKNLDLLVEEINMSFIITPNKNYFIDDNLEKIDGKVKVLGKIVRVEEEGINLLENTPLAGFKEEFIKQAFEGFDMLLNQDDYFSLSKTKINTNQKTYRVIPIGVYI